VLLSGNDLPAERFLRNRQRGEAVVLRSMIRDPPVRGLLSTAVLATRRTGVVGQAAAVLGGPVDDAWIEDAELVFISFERLARFTRHVTLTNFVLPEAAVTREGGKAGAGGR
jgi:hypothetical protein